MRTSPHDVHVAVKVDIPDGERVHSAAIVRRVADAQLFAGVQIQRTRCDAAVPCHLVVTVTNQSEQRGQVLVSHAADRSLEISATG